MKYLLRILITVLFLVTNNAHALESTPLKREKNDIDIDIDKVIILAKKGEVAAQTALGAMYYSGIRGMPKDSEKAYEWLSKAAAQNSSGAQLMLGYMYYEGNGIPEDHSKAFKWFMKAATQNDIDAQYQVGLLYYEGDGVPQNYSEAYLWLNLAAVGGNPKIIEARNIVANKMTPNQLFIAQQFASMQHMSNNIIKDVTKKPANKEKLKQVDGQIHDSPLSINEKDSIRQQFMKNWKIPFGSSDRQNSVVTISVKLQPDGTVSKSEIVNQARYNEDKEFHKLADSALLAVNKSSPLLGLPANKYDIKGGWKELEINFDPREMVN